MQFEKHEHEGIDPHRFAESLIASGLVLTDDVRWLSFHSGYDFGYMLHVVTGQDLPTTEKEFFEQIRYIEIILELIQRVHSN